MTRQDWFDATLLISILLILVATAFLGVHAC